MKKSILAVSVLATLAIAAPASADKSDRARDAAAKACHAEKKADPVAFEGTYGPEHAMRNCIKATTPEAKSAAKDCKAERDARSRRVRRELRHERQPAATRWASASPRSWRSTPV